MVTEFQKGEAIEFLSAVVINANADAMNRNPRLNEYDNVVNELEGLKLISIDREAGTELILDKGLAFIAAAIGDLYMNYMENLRVGILEGEALQPKDFNNTLNEFIKLSVTSGMEPSEPVPLNLTLQILYLMSVGLNKFDEYYSYTQIRSI